MIKAFDLPQSAARRRASTSPGLRTSTAITSAEQRRRSPGRARAGSCRISRAVPNFEQADAELRGKLVPPCRGSRSAAKTLVELVDSARYVFAERPLRSTTRPRAADGRGTLAAWGNLRRVAGRSRPGPVERRAGRAPLRNGGESSLAASPSRCVLRSPAGPPRRDLRCPLRAGEKREPEPAAGSGGKPGLDPERINSALLARNRPRGAPAQGSGVPTAMDAGHLAVHIRMSYAVNKALFRRLRRGLHRTPGGIGSASD